MTYETFAARLSDDARALALPLDDEAISRLHQYHELLLEWNARIDLTSVTDEDAMLRAHYVDALLALRVRGLFARGARVIDVGTGAGLPGLPLLIARPDLQVTLLDALEKRCAFLGAVAAKIGLAPTILHARAEDAGRDKALRERFDLALARAVAPLSTVQEYLAPFVKPGGHTLCWKGPRALDELPAAQAACPLLGLSDPQLLDAGLPDTRHVFVLVKKAARTPPAYPRRGNAPKRAPLGVL